MRIVLHIDRLVLDGLALTRPQAVTLQAAMEGELGRLLASLSPSHKPSGAEVSALRPSSFASPANAAPDAIGLEIARSVHGAVTPLMGSRDG